MKNEDILESYGVFAVVSEDCLTLGVGLGAEVFAVAQTSNPIPPREWQRVLSVAWADPSEGAIQRAIDLVPAEYGPVRACRPTPLRVNFQHLGPEIPE